MRLLIHWVLSALALLLVSNLVSGFQVSGLVAALIAAVVIGLVNGTLGMFVKVITLPFTLITLGLFLLVINALMLLLCSAILPGFHITGFWPALWGGVVLSILNMVIRAVMKTSAEK